METLNEIVGFLAQSPKAHVRDRTYTLLSKIAENEAVRHFGPESGADANSWKSRGQFTGPLRDIQFPFHSMGNITSLHLFGLDELVLFAFYWSNRTAYKNVLDIGANIGLHSIVMDRCGFQVTAFEPDPITFDVLRKHLQLNDCRNVRAINAAVSTSEGTMEFVRVLGNMTGSYLAGAKQNSYGELETISVKVENFKKHVREADFAKIDVEGHEKALFLCTERDDWRKLDAIAEIGTKENAIAVFEHLTKLGVNMFAQKKAWARVENLDDMPFSYKDGSLFVSMKSQMPWPEAE